MGTELMAREDRTPSLPDLLPPRVAEHVRSLPENYINKPERDLKRLLRPPALACRIRMQFWVEFERAHQIGKRMKMENVYAGCCSDEMFYTWVIKDKKQLAWIVCPPADYLVSLKEILHLATENMREILEKPLPARKLTSADVKLASLQADIWKKIDERVHGAVVQRLDARHVHQTVEAPKPPEEQKELLKQLEEEHRGVSEIEVNGKTED